ncbi:retrovirus-related pol polyprotein from transposon TNT 1-94 [Tanacetum coccineum]
MSQEIVHIVANSVDIFDVKSLENSGENLNAPTFNQLFEINELKAQSQEKDTVIRKLKERIKSLSGKDSMENVKKDIDEIESISIKLEHNLNAQLQEKVFAITALKNELRKLKRKNVVNTVVSKPNATLASGMFKINIEPISPRLKNNKDAHEVYIEKTIEYNDTLCGFVERARTQYPSEPLLESACMFTKHVYKLLVYASQTCPNSPKPSEKLVAVTSFNKDKRVRFAEPVVQIVLWYLDSRCSKHMTRNRSQLMNFVSKFLGTVRFENNQVAKIMGYGDYQQGNIIISRLYYVEWLRHNLISVGQFCDAYLEVAFQKNTCFIRNLEGVDLLSGSRDTNLYTISLDDMLNTSPICLLSKASKTKSWLWHRRLSHLNFGTLNKLAKDGLARGIPKLKFQKDHLCSTCALRKSKKSSHQPKAEDTNQEKLHLLHMDLCGLMRVESINGKKYILVIVDDYSRFSWVKILRSKDEAPDAIIKCIKNIQVRLNATIRNVRTDNGTEFVNQTLHDFYKNVGISHQTQWNMRLSTDP